MRMVSLRVFARGLVAQCEAAFFLHGDEASIEPALVWCRRGPILRVAVVQDNANSSVPFLPERQVFRRRAPDRARSCSGPGRSTAFRLVVCKEHRTGRRALVRRNSWSRASQFLMRLDCHTAEGREQGCVPEAFDVTATSPAVPTVKVLPASMAELFSRLSSEASCRSLPALHSAVLPCLGQIRTSQRRQCELASHISHQAHGQQQRSIRKIGRRRDRLGPTRLGVLEDREFSRRELKMHCRLGLPPTSLFDTTVKGK